MKNNLIFKDKIFKNFFITATFFEAKAVLIQRNFNKIQRNLFCNNTDILLITGIGKNNVLKNQNIIKNISSHKTINLGFAGAVKGCDLFQCFKLDSCISEDTLQINNIEYPFTKPLLVSLEKPLQNPSLFCKKFSFLNSYHSVLVDMEAFWIQQIKPKLRILKIISDNGSTNFKQNFLKNKEVLEKNLISLLKNNFF